MEVMTALGTRFVGPFALLVALVVLTSCSDDSGAASTAAATPSSSSASDDPDCAGVIPDAAWAPLGWPGGEPASEHAGRCQRITEDVGQVTVGTLPVTGAEADRTDNARSVYDDECTRLRDSGGYVAEPAEELAPGQTACGLMTDHNTKTGVAELILLTATDEVVQMRVVVVDPTSPNRVMACFRRLTGISRDCSLLISRKSNAA